MPNFYIYCNCQGAFALTIILAYKTAALLSTPTLGIQNKSFKMGVLEVKNLEKKFNIPTFQLEKF